MGLLENLIARAIESGPGGNVRYAVIAGGRRLTALIDLAREGMLSTDYPVPCRVVGDDAPESELSLAENVVRAAMHPADQVEAFAGLADGGATVAEIAARFGVAERLVEQRLRLGNAAPVLLDAYREGGIDLEVLTAFAVTADRERQIAVWEQVKEQGYRPGAWQIKRMLTEDRVAARTAIARFVGIEAYEAAGGAVQRATCSPTRTITASGSTIPNCWTSSPRPSLSPPLTISAPNGSGPRRGSRWTGTPSPGSGASSPPRQRRPRRNAPNSNGSRSARTR